MHAFIILNTEFNKNTLIKSTLLAKHSKFVVTCLVKTILAMNISLL